MSEEPASNHHAMVFSVQLNEPGEAEADSALDRETRLKAIESQLMLSTSPISPPPLRTEVAQNSEQAQVSGKNYFYEQTVASPPSTPSSSVMPPNREPGTFSQNGYYANGDFQSLNNGGNSHTRDHAIAPSSNTQSDTNNNSNANNHTRSSTSMAEPSHISSSRMSSISSTANFFDRPEKKLLVPPLNFAMVTSGIYRSGHPLPINFPFLEKLKLKTIIYLGEHDLRKINVEWAARNGIKIFHFQMENCKLPFVENDPEAIAAALQVVVDARNFPILMHSNKGKHRVGVLVGAMRKLLQKYVYSITSLGTLYTNAMDRWSLASVFDEYGQFAAGKEDSDIEFIEIFNAELRYDPRYAPSWLR
ncbi:tyrosine phosphatase family-domain-containing protein [Lipomyces tetrasporus]|uniref:Tyrosine phosphatase family-domain-containing protein n=1 Tax=Lipomyces tetrasporus TaxID=54092 RepID=A0AAD7R0A4_9ASCO|nr:tyrosine phosphatase family-domain-containing protein [Lipomyces tetrasporus]KAJ8104151.1 tyrosine phosphatase family-domain-containing protein [Lipomyces tetrasporus]